MAMKCACFSQLHLPRPSSFTSVALIQYVRYTGHCSVGVPICHSKVAACIRFEVNTGSGTFGKVLRHRKRGPQVIGPLLLVVWVAVLVHLS